MSAFHPAVRPEELKRIERALESSQRKLPKLFRQRSAFSGELADIGLMSLLQTLGANRSTGTLLGVTLSVSQLIIGLAAARIAYLLLFPAGLGVLEAGQVAAVRALGFPAALGFSLSLVIRFRDVVVAAVGLWWGMRMLMKR